MGRTIDQLAVGERVPTSNGGMATITAIDGDVITTGTDFHWIWDGEQLVSINGSGQGLADSKHVTKVITMVDLKLLRQWVGYKLVPKQNGKIDKVPKDPHTGRSASSIDPSTWGTAAQTWAAKRRYGFDGIGFVFTIDTGIVGTDLDCCFERSVNGVRHFKPWARDVVQCLDSYTEYSPSRNGVHVLTRGEIPYSITKNKIGFEMYNEARFFTVTGAMIGDVLEIRERPTELLALHVTFEDAPRVDTLPDSKPRSGNIPSKDSIRAMLAVIPMHQEYMDWLKCLMAVHDVYPGGDGVQLVEEWAPGYRGEVAGKFRSFDRTAKDGVTIATLFHMAKLNGWRAERHRTARYADNVGRLMGA